MNLRNGIIAAVFLVLAAVAVTGWTRNGDRPQPVYAAAPCVDSPNVQTTAYPNTAAPYPSNAAPYPNTGVAYPYADGNGPGRYVGGYRPVRYGGSYSGTADREVVRDREVRQVVTSRRHGRSTGKSVAIVAGSAGVGAAIGGIAGGGKGAGIGALSGGAAGFIYDRITHNR
jgi:hypothetical protein